MVSSYVTCVSGSAIPRVQHNAGITAPEAIRQGLSGTPGDRVATLGTAGRGSSMTGHTVVVAGAGPTGLILAGELALAGVDVAIVERRPTQELAGSRAGGLSSRTIEVFDQRGIADRFLSAGQVAQVTGFAVTRPDISDFPTRHSEGLALWQGHIERSLADWVRELKVAILYGRAVTGFAQGDTGVDVRI